MTTHLSILNLVIGKQLDWSRDWAASLLGMLAKDEATSRWDYLKALGYEEWEGDYRWGRILSDPRETPEEDACKCRNDSRMGATSGIQRPTKLCSH